MPPNYHSPHPFTLHYGRPRTGVAVIQPPEGIFSAYAIQNLDLPPSMWHVCAKQNPRDGEHPSRTKWFVSSQPSGCIGRCVHLSWASWDSGLSNIFLTITSRLQSQSHFDSNTRAMVLACFESFTAAQWRSVRAQSELSALTNFVWEEATTCV
jgi:hypothetical protein